MCIVVPAKTRHDSKIKSYRDITSLKKKKRETVGPLGTTAPD